MEVRITRHIEEDVEEEVDQTGEGMEVEEDLIGEAFVVEEGQKEEVLEGVAWPWEGGMKMVIGGAEMILIWVSPLVGTRGHSTLKGGRVMMVDII